jgi:hypothetical protein
MQQTWCVQRIPEKKNDLVHSCAAVLLTGVVTHYSSSNFSHRFKILRNLTIFWKEICLVVILQCHKQYYINITLSMPWPTHWVSVIVLAKCFSCKAFRHVACYLYFSNPEIWRWHMCMHVNMNIQDHIYNESSLSGYHTFRPINNFWKEWRFLGE